MKQYPGLYNSICKNPLYYCSSKKLYLDKRHAEKKHCLCKPTVDMISTRKCPYLIPLEEHERYQQNMKERLEIAKQNYSSEKNF